MTVRRALYDRPEDPGEGYLWLSPEGPAIFVGGRWLLIVTGAEVGAGTGAGTGAGEDDGGLVTLAECPPGFFLFGGDVHFKTEYATEIPKGSLMFWPDAYCGSSGEFFWGGAKTHEDRARLMVRPLDIGEIAVRAGRGDPDGW